MHLSFDIEALGVAANTVVLSVGVTQIQPPDDEKPSPSFDPVYIVPDRIAQLKNGRTADVSTLLWWMQQHPQACEVFSYAQPTEPQAAAAAIATLVEQATTIWANGPDYDFKILADFVTQYIPGFKWPFYKHRCVRTLKNMFSDYIDPPERVTHHNALDDARVQGDMVEQTLKALKVRGVHCRW